MDTPAKAVSGSSRPADSEHRPAPSPDSINPAAPERGPAAQDAWPLRPPGIDFDSALLTAALGFTRRPLALRECATLIRQLALGPERLIQPLSRLAGETARIATGRSRSEPGSGDRRYQDRSWTTNPVFRALAQQHTAIASAVEDVLDRAELSAADRFRLELIAVNVLAALAPANWPATNPAAWKATIDTGAHNLVLGAQRFTYDIRQPSRLPARSEPGEFTLGEELAATPGAVVLRTPVMELLQYDTTSDEVLTEPLLIVPSLINKYYLTDLASGRSLVEHTVREGAQTFHVSWINPDKTHRSFDLDTYIAAIVEALDAVKEVTGAERVHVVGTCAGGQLLAIAIAYLTELGRHDEIATYTLPVCVMDHSDQASLSGLLSREMVDAAATRIERDGLVDGRTLGGALAWLRPTDGIWWPWVQRYLLATDIPRLDLFHWAEDTANLPARLVLDLFELMLDNKLTKPNALRVLGRPIDLSRISNPAYLMAGLNDHLTAWRSCYATTRMVGSEVCFVLVPAGHLQAILQAPGPRALEFRTAPATPAGPDAWLETATAHPGSWWDHWLGWLAQHSAGKRAAPVKLGSDTHPPLDQAPGTYIRRRLDQT
jgi:polyhydroxyalkanoate synthase